MTRFSIKNYAWRLKRQFTQKWIFYNYLLALMLFSDLLSSVEHKIYIKMKWGWENEVRNWIFRWTVPLTYINRHGLIMWQNVCYLWIWDLRGLLCETAALCWDQVIVLGADVLIGIVQTAWTGSRRWPDDGIKIV